MHVRDYMATSDGGFVTVNFAQFDHPVWKTIGVLRRSDRILVVVGDDEFLLTPTEPHGSFVCSCEGEEDGPCVHLHAAQLVLFGWDKSNSHELSVPFSQEELEKFATSFEGNSRKLGDPPM